ncbi:beta-alanyl-dopamine/carcinine hydrolase isoform X2 [Battus philenor]|uniref:beta-alanyl-dopamine/carcinine hydrolase isoform X2 n=1 Tax=Battus philenor TaxID=42288 RepID=UPI0035D07A35
MRELNGNSMGEKHIGRRRVVPVIYLQGSHYEIGYDVGRNFASVIQSFLETYQGLKYFEKEYKTSSGRTAYDETLANMKQRYPYYVKEIQGVADGANVSFHQLFLLHMDDIIGTINDNSVSRNDTGGCSDIAFNSPDNIVLGHTEDAPMETLNHFYIMSAHVIPTPEDKAHGAVEERFASLCYAGQLPGYTMGFNENGLVFTINTLSPLNLKPGNTPRTFITRALLAARTPTEADKILLDEGLGIGNGFSTNMIWTDKKGNRQLANVEVAPDLKADKSILNVHKYSNDTLMHCNAYLRQQVQQVTGDIIDSSITRMKAIKHHPAPQTRSDIEHILSDTTYKDYPVFQTRLDAPIQTIAAGIFDMKASTWSIYIDKPVDSEPVAILPMRFSMLHKV